MLQPPKSPLARLTLLVLVVILTTCSKKKVNEPSEAQISIQGTVEANPYTRPDRPNGEGCSSRDGVMKIGTAVLVRDEGDRIVGKSSLSRSETTNDGAIDEKFRCRLYWFSRVKLSEFFQVTIGGVDGGTYGREELEEKDWKLQVPYGDFQGNF